MNDFREALVRFRDAVRQEGERTKSPGLHAILQLDRRAATNLRVLWAVAIVAALVLGAVPAYENAQQRQHVATQATEDALLLEQVNAGLSRSVPRAMAPLMGWTPGN